VALVGHGNPEDFPWSPWDFGMGRTVGLWWPWWDMGIPRTSHGHLGTLGWEGQWDWGGLDGTWESRGLPMVPLGLWDGKDSGTGVALVGHGNPKDFPWSPWDFGIS